MESPVKRSEGTYSPDCLFKIDHREEAGFSEKSLQLWTLATCELNNLLPVLIIATSGTESHFRFCL